MAEATLHGAQVFIFLGRTGSGKSKIADAVKKKLGLPSVSLGKIVRAEIKKGSELGKKVEPFVKAGQAFPTNVAIKLIEDTLIGNARKFRKGFVLDNFPMTSRHIPRFEILLRKHGMNVNTVYHVHAPKSVSDARRAKEPRGKAGAKTAEREKTFKAETMRVLMHYRKKVRTLPSTQSVAKNVATVRKAFKAVERKKTRVRRGKK